MISTPELPGLRFESVGERPAPSPLRSDVAGFVGRTRRGPVGQAVRVQGLREYQAVFGGLDPDEPLTYAIRGYFENGGQVAHVVRVINSSDAVFQGMWRVVPDDGSHDHWICATSPGRWARGMRVSLTYLEEGPTREPTVEFVVRAEREPIERFRVILPDAVDDPAKKAFEEDVARKSNLIRVITADSPPLQQSVFDSFPRRFPWLEVELSEQQPAAERSTMLDYRDALTLLCDVSEVAIIAMPGLYADESLSCEQRKDLVAAAAFQAAELQDRLVLVDVLPPGKHDELTSSRIDDGEISRDDVVSFVDAFRNRLATAATRRAAALYHPWLRVDDPLGDVTRPLRTIPPSGHVAGVMSRVDRERGAHYTPANVPVWEAVDVETQYERGAGGNLNEAGVNLIRCVPGKGLMVWGGRTLDLSRDGRFVAHRRFIHRLIRAIRRVAEPVVFETNGPELWLILVRAVTTVLLEAFRGGALQGARPEEAFRVRCDEQTSPLSEREQGRVLCEIDLALAAPMEFITIRVSVSREGQVEVFDA